MKFGRRNRSALDDQIESAPEKQPEPAVAPLFEPPPSTRGAGRTLARDLGLLLLIFVVGFAIAFIWLAPGPLLASDHSSPDVVGMPGDQAEKLLGTVTILVNNAGVAHSTRATEVTEDEWNHVVRTNLDAVFFWAQEGARRMLKANAKGAIVNIASVLGFGVSKGTIAYATAKAGVIQMTKALGNELAFKGVRVNAIAPGWFVTDINRDYLSSEAGKKLTRDIPVGRFGQDGDLDGALLLLASNAGSYIAGATIVCDGGQMVALRG